MSDTRHDMFWWRRDATEMESGLAAWARHVRGEGAVITDLRSPSTGFQNETVLFRLDGEPLVARLAPPPTLPCPIFPSYDLERQQRVMQLVRRRSSAPVPEVVHLERSVDWLGVPFLVTRAVEGLVPSDDPVAPYLADPAGWFLQGRPEDWRRFETSTIDALVKVHRILDDGEETAFLRPDALGETALARQVAYQRQYYEWAREGRTIPILERALDVLTKTMPPNDRSVLNWGDSRSANIIYREFEPVALLDWETATVGPPEIDVAWLVFYEAFLAEIAQQSGRTPAVVFDQAATVATYEGLSGDRLDDLAWYLAYSCVRLANLAARTVIHFAARGTPEPADPDDLVGFRPILERSLSAL